MPGTSSASCVKRGIITPEAIRGHYASLHTRSGRSSRHASPRDTAVSPSNMYSWGVCPCSTPEPADYLSAQDVVWDTRALRLALPEILHSRGNFSSSGSSNWIWFFEEPARQRTNSHNYPKGPRRSPRSQEAGTETHGRIRGSIFNRERQRAREDRSRSKLEDQLLRRLDRDRKRTGYE